MEQPIINPPNPYVGTLRIFPGTLVKISGQPRANATRFAINLQTGPSLNPRDDLALHLSPCFTPPRVIRNSLRHNAWGLEEAWGNGSILNPHQPFEIMLLAEPDQFKIAINGMHYCEFKHRIPYQEISHLTIDGDVDIHRISITAGPQSQPNPAAAAAYHHQPSAPPTSNMPPYPTSNTSGMPMPSAYPALPGGGPPQPTGYYPPTSGGSGYGAPPGGPMPAAATYMSGYPTQPGAPAGHYPQIPQGQYQPGPYPAMPSGPSPTGATYQGGYPQQPHAPQHHQQPGHSSASPFSSLPIGGKALGTLAGLGLAGAAGAAVLSAANPLKKIMKPKKLFKHKKGWGRSSSSSSSSSNSSRGSFSSNSS